MQISSQSVTDLVTKSVIIFKWPLNLRSFVPDGFCDEIRDGGGEKHRQRHRQIVSTGAFHLVVDGTT